MGDIVYNTDNPVFLRCSMKNETNPIMYDKQAAKSQKICHRNFVETDIRGFGTKVGTYSNYSTIIEAMLPMFPNANQEKQREELLTRKKLLREINGQEIDRIKGVEAKGPDKEVWLKHWKINPEDSEQVRAEKYYHNSLVIAKKPYFFRYLYSELNQQYKKYESQYNEISKCLFRTKLKKLITKENKTDAEKAFVKRYHKFSPLISTNCTMNIMCRKIESIDFDIQYSKDCESMLPYKDLSTFDIDESILLKFRKMYQRYSNKKVLTYVNYIYDGCPDEDYKEVRFGAIDAIRDDIQEELADMSLSTLDALTYIKVLSISYAKFNWAFAWDLLEDSILDVIQTKDAIAPVEDPSGQEYLGRYYILKTIPKPLPKIVIGTEMDNMFWYTEGEI